MMPQIMSEALNLAVYGMGTVFIFLTVLVGLTTLMSKFALYLDKLNPPAPEPHLPSTPAATSQTSPALVAAVAAAVEQYRKSKR